MGDQNNVQGGHPVDVANVDQRNLQVMPVNNVTTESSGVPKLKGANYLNWRSVIKDVLSLRGLAKAVLEDDRSDTTRNLQAKLLIKGSLDESYLAEVRDYEYADEIWAHLSRMCIGANSTDITLLVRKFYNYQYLQGDTMGTHLEKLATMRNQLEVVNQGPTDEVFIDRILQTLPTEYEKLKENWDYLHPSQKNIPELKSRILKIQEDIKNSAELKPAIQAFVVSDQSKNSRQADIMERKKNSHCAKCGIKGHWYRECKTKPENYVKKKDHVNSESKDKESPISFMMGNLKKDALSMSTNKDLIKNYWIADSGATNHMCNQEKWFKSMSKYSEPRVVSVGDNRDTLVTGIGSVEVSCNVGGRYIIATIDEVLLVPNLASNLLSIGQIDAKGFNTVFKQSKLEVLRGTQLVASGSKLSNNLYLMDMVAIKAGNSQALFCQMQRSIDEWHRTLGHASKNRILKLSKDVDTGLKISDPKSELECGDCPPGKGRHVSHPSKDHRATDVGHRVHIDLSGPVNESSSNGNKYFMLCKDEWSTFTYVYLLQDKSQANLALAKLFAEFEIELGNKIQRIQSDCGSEFVNNRNEILFALERVIHEKSAPYSPQQNGTIEREIQTVVYMARTMLQASGLPTKLWDEAIRTACFIRNRLPNASTEVTPFELVMKRKPKLKHLCEFGTPAHVMIDGHHLTKFEPRTEQAYVVGFTNRTNTYRVYLKQSEKVTESCNVIFKPHRPASKNDETKTSNVPDEVKIGLPIRQEGLNPIDPEMARQKNLLDEFFSTYCNNKSDDLQTEYHDAHECNEEEQNTSKAISEEESPPFSPITDHGNHSEQPSQLSSHEDQGEPLSPPNLSEHEDLSRSDCCDNRAFLSASVTSEPTSYKEAVNGINGENWGKAVEEEFDAHDKNGTWIVL